MLGAGGDGPYRSRRLELREALHRSLVRKVRDFGAEPGQMRRRSPRRDGQGLHEAVHDPECLVLGDALGLSSVPQSRRYRLARRRSEGLLRVVAVAGRGQRLLEGRLLNAHELTQSEESDKRLVVGTVEGEVDVGPADVGRVVDVGGGRDEWGGGMVLVAGSQRMAAGKSDMVGRAGGDRDEEVAEVPERDLRVEVAGDQPDVLLKARVPAETGGHEAELERCPQAYRVVGTALVLDETGELPAGVELDILGVFEALLPSPAVDLLARKRRTLGRRVGEGALRVGQIRLFEREVGAQASAPIDREPMDVAIMDVRPRL